MVFTWHSTAKALLCFYVIFNTKKSIIKAIVITVNEMCFTFANPESMSAVYNKNLNAGDRSGEFSVDFY